MKKLSGPKWLKVNNSRNSLSSCRLDRLNWQSWWTDGKGSIYLHVDHKYDGTTHRVYCRRGPGVRIGMRAGELCWLVDHEN